MPKLLMCGVSAYLVFSGSVWGPVCGGIVILITFWDYFSGVAGEMAEDYAATLTRRRLRSDFHAPAHPYWTLLAFASRKIRSTATSLDDNFPFVFASLPLVSRCRVGILAVRSLVTLRLDDNPLRSHPQP